jgi:uncharacterized protein (DUF1330 family)
MMSAYLVVQVEVTDPETYEGYKKLVAPTIEANGGRYLVRGGATETLEGEGAPGRLVILEFPSVEQAKAWWSSEEYRIPKGIRQSSSRTNMILAEGL